MQPDNSAGDSYFNLNFRTEGTFKYILLLIWTLVSILTLPFTSYENLGASFQPSVYLTVLISETGQ